jgi:two-component system, cell cycle response regulator
LEYKSFAICLNWQICYIFHINDNVTNDRDIALKFMLNRLRHFGYEGELAKSGQEALALVGKTSYQLVFLDVMMAGLDGYKTCRAIKNSKARCGPAPVVVMLTSRGGTSRHHGRL